MPRPIVLHYHLFKNAGTSVDHLLKQSFEGRWRGREFREDVDDNSAEVARWISDDPDGVAFSSHTMLGPVPQIPGVGILSILMLRDPIARIVSAYRFERCQQADTWGANLAKKVDFEGYVRARLERRNDMMCNNFQVFRLSLMQPGDAAPLHRAQAALDAVTVAGLVDEFDAAMSELHQACAAHGLSFTPQPVRRNESRPSVPVEIGPELARDLEAANTEDRKLVDFLRARKRVVEETTQS